MPAKSRSFSQHSDFIRRRVHASVQCTQRESLIEEEREARREQDTAHHREQRESMGESDDDVIRDHNTVAHEEARGRTAPQIPLDGGIKVHQLGTLMPCNECLAFRWPEEKRLCCTAGKHVLGDIFWPPMTPEYEALLFSDRAIPNLSRRINAATAFTNLRVHRTNREGPGFTYDLHPGAFVLHGRTYHKTSA